MHPVWSHHPRVRQLVLLRWADRLEKRQEELAHILTCENGTVLVQARGELLSAISEIRYYAGLARHLPGNVLETEPGVYSTMLKEAAGVAAIVVPWNAPAALLIRSLAPALDAGCTAFVKPAPQMALINLALICELNAVDALPAGVVNLVAETGHAVAQVLVASEKVAVLSFTGFNETGQRIMAAAAPIMKKLSLELGGKSCVLVFNDVEIAKVAAMLTSAAIVISGQQCTAARRVLVHASRYEEMKQALTACFNNVIAGPGTRAGVHMGPLIDDVALTSVQRKIALALDTCDEVLVRGVRLEGALASGHFLTPTLIAHQDENASFSQEEIFGPFLIMEKFSSESEAVARQQHAVRVVSQRMDVECQSRHAHRAILAQWHRLDQ